MARRKRKKARVRRQRVYQHITKPVRLLPSPFSKAPFRRRIPSEEIIDDRRRYLPSLAPLALYDDGRPVSYGLRDRTVRGRPYRSLAYVRLGFVNPLRVRVCQRRKERRETLFRMQKIGRGKGAGRKRRRITAESSIRC